MSCTELDRDIIAQVLGGRQELYAVLVNRYREQTYGLLRGIGASHEDAQDVAQEAFIKAYRKLADHDPCRSFAAWLYTITVRTYQDRCKRKQITLIEWDQESVADETTPEMLYLRAESRQHVQQFIQQLPPAQRIVILLRYTNECTYEEICEITSLTMHQVKNALYRAKKSLKKLIEQGGSHDVREVSDVGEMSHV
ncbi:RNA polymerase sigma factor [Paenibacillus alvei]|uniref:RNA polymerase sigma factor n=1 Tax=Paenibacillus alvei TaxID=44250 RepID=A0ABT4GZ76_PAEAL|nr:MULTISPECIES: RNA polymerase sigma factor [Paenibacillus]EJW16156.1 RNA polymerase, sigma-24 subunit, ECF subfamily [Paenibacillus alvei DSM 29]MCY7482966.1 RNA polymerase sigma factor [Paenibacillus alvei]MCY9543424.1 RNA polymerase sigma factor [Paenibacillus alvei]MCY9704506.1 RNA polymerase sigma factor [Paenibacillus alvei]MCY9732834.1 RNA polymerase sigma factor [Paenibacillus alvei]